MVRGSVRQIIVDTLAGRPYGYTSRELMGLVYARDPSGGPEDFGVLRVNIYHANKELAGLGYRIRTTHRGPGARYQLTNRV